MPDFDDNKGVSLVLVNSAKRGALFNGIQESVIARQSSVQDCVQHNLQDPTYVNPRIGSDFGRIQNDGF